MLFFFTTSVSWLGVLGSSPERLRWLTRPSYTSRLMVPEFFVRNLIRTLKNTTLWSWKIIGSLKVPKNGVTMSGNWPLRGTPRYQNTLKLRIGGFLAHICWIKKSDSRNFTKIFEIFENRHPKWRPRGSKNRWCTWTIHTSFWS